MQVAELRLADRLLLQGSTNLLVWLSLRTGVKTVSQNMVPLAKPRELELQNQGLTMEVSGSGANYTVTERTKHPALWVWMDIGGGDARWSDHFIPVSMDSSAVFTVRIAQSTAKDHFITNFQARSLSTPATIEI